MALTGLALSLFLVGHMFGNLFLFVGEDAFNKYARAMMANPLLIPIELVLIAIFLTHVIFAILLTRSNRAARPVAYAVKQASDASLASRTMILSGLVVFGFLIMHLLNFKYSDFEAHPQFLYGVVIDYLANPVNAGVYVACMIILGLHLSHGIQSTFQSCGLDHPGYTPTIKKLCFVVAIVLTIGFSSMPLYAMFIKGGA